MHSLYHLLYEITQCYLPPDRGDCHAFTPAYCRYSFIDPGGTKGWADLGGWLYQDGLPTHRWSPIQVLTGPDVE